MNAPDMRDADDEASCVIVCAGPPLCHLQGFDAIREQTAGCPWCRRIRIDTDGTESILQDWPVTQ